MVRAEESAVVEVAPALMSDSAISHPEEPFVMVRGWKGVLTYDVDEEAPKELRVGPGG